MAHSHSSRLLLRATAAALLLGGLALWLSLRQDPVASGGAPSTHSLPQALDPRQPQLERSEPALHAAVEGPHAPMLALAEPREPQPGKEGEHPHPIDAKRQRIYRENNLHAALMGAMNVGDYLGLRALVEEYRMDYPEDEYRLQAGYGLIADCLEKLTPERQAAARAYWQTNRGSIVRRFIRRTCLEQPLANN